MMPPVRQEPWYVQSQRCTLPVGLSCSLVLSRHAACHMHVAAAANRFNDDQDVHGELWLQMRLVGCTAMSCSVADLDKGSEDVVQGVSGGLRHVEDGKLALQAVGDVVLASARHIHGRHIPVKHMILNELRQVLRSHRPHQTASWSLRALQFGKKAAP